METQSGIPKQYSLFMKIHIYESLATCNQDRRQKNFQEGGQRKKDRKMAK